MALRCRRVGAVHRIIRDRDIAYENPPMSAIPRKRPDFGPRACKAGSSSSVTEEYDHARQCQFRVADAQADTLEQRETDRRQAAATAETSLGDPDQAPDRTTNARPGDVQPGHRQQMRGCDVVAIKVEDVAPNGYAVDRATVRQRKTGRPVRFELTEQTRHAVDDYIRTAGKKLGEFLFTARRSQERRMTTRQYARLLSEWIAGIGLDPRLFGTHFLRRTKATLIYRRTGNLRAVQLLLGHTKIESTVRYLGIEVDDALSIAEQVDL